MMAPKASDAPLRPAPPMLLVPALAQAPAACIGDDAALSVLRRHAAALADGNALSRCNDHALLAALDGAQARTLAGDAAPPRLYHLAPKPAPGSAAPAPAAAAPTAPRAAAAPAAATQDDSAFISNIDGAAMAEGLRNAARDGVPFCEECARAAAAQARALAAAA